MTSGHAPIYSFTGNLLRYDSSTSVHDTFGYDSNDRLTCIFHDPNNDFVKDGSEDEAFIYRYDALGRRVEKKVGESITRFIYLGWRCMQERDASDNLVAEYIYGNNLDEVLQMKRKDVDDVDGDDDRTEWFTYHYHTDAQGNVVAVTLAGGDFWDGTAGNEEDPLHQLALGTVMEKYEYDVYGKVIIKDRNGTVLSQSAIKNPFMFQGQRYDEESGLYYFKNRYYDPEMGRFITRDPAGMVDGPNLYAFVNDNPINYADPLGLCQTPLPPAAPPCSSCPLLPDGSPAILYRGVNDMSELDIALAPKVNPFEALARYGSTRNAITAHVQYGMPTNEISLSADYDVGLRYAHGNPANVIALDATQIDLVPKSTISEIGGTTYAKAARDFEFLARGGSDGISQTAVIDSSAAANATRAVEVEPSVGLLSKIASNPALRACGRVLRGGGRFLGWVGINLMIYELLTDVTDGNFKAQFEQYEEYKKDWAQFPPRTFDDLEHKAEEQNDQINSRNGVPMTEVCPISKTEVKQDHPWTQPYLKMGAGGPDIGPDIPIQVPTRGRFTREVRIKVIYE